MSPIWLRRESVALAITLLGTMSYLILNVLTIPRGALHLAASCSLAAGLSAMALATLSDWRKGEVVQRFYLVVLLPWCTALVYGLLGRWLVLRSAGTQGVTLAEQSVLGLAILAMMFQLLIVVRWRTSLSRGNGNGLLLQGIQRTMANLVDLRTWLGAIAPAMLLTLIIMGLGLYSAALAWLLLLVGDGAWHYLLLLLLRRRPQTV